MKRVTTDSDALDLIAFLVDGTQWDADTLDHIAQVVRETGRHVNEPKEGEEA